jgi:hypothetical protein
VIFVQQAGATRYEHICESIETFAAKVMPEFADREVAYAERKRRELMPAIEAALARKRRLPPIDEAAIPVVEALGRKGASPLQGPSDRGGAIPIASSPNAPASPPRRRRTPPGRPRRRRRSSRRRNRGPKVNCLLPRPPRGLTRGSAGKGRG